MVLIMTASPDISIASDPSPGVAVPANDFVRIWMPKIVELKDALAHQLDGKATARSDYGMDYVEGIDFGTIRKLAAETLGFPFPYIYQCGNSAPRSSKRTPTPAGVGIETVDARGRKVVPLWTVEGGNIPLTDERLLAWTFDQCSRQVGTGRRDTLCGPVIATPAAAQAIDLIYTGPCLRTMLGDDGTKDGNKVDLDNCSKMRITAHLIRSCNLVDLRFTTWEEDVTFNGTTLTLSGRAKNQPAALLHGCIGKRLSEVIGSTLLRDDPRTITSIRRLGGGQIQFGVSQPREGIVLDI